MKRSHRKFIIYNHTLEEYYSKYRHRREHLLKYTRKEVEAVDYDGNLYNHKLLKGHRWWCIDNTYYEIPKPPRMTWFRNLKTSTQVVTYIILGGLVISSIAIPTTLLINRLKNINNSNDINVINENDANDIINPITLKLTTTGDYIGNIKYKEGRAFNFIESYTIKLNDNTLSRDNDYKLNASNNTLTIFSKTTINKNSKVAINIVKAKPSIILDKTTLSLPFNQEYTFTFTLKSLLGDPEWSSSDDAKVQVIGDAKIKAVGNIGEGADITATLGSTSASCKVTIIA